VIKRAAILKPNFNQPAQMPVESLQLKSWLARKSFLNSVITLRVNLNNNLTLEVLLTHMQANLREKPDVLGYTLVRF
jgi:hypothetical protein